MQFGRIQLSVKVRYVKQEHLINHNFKRPSTCRRHNQMDGLLFFFLTENNILLNLIPSRDLTSILIKYQYTYQVSVY